MRYLNNHNPRKVIEKADPHQKNDPLMCRHPIATFLLALVAKRTKRSNSATLFRGLCSCK